MPIILDATTGNITGVANLASASVNTATTMRDSNNTEIAQLAKAWINFDGTTTPPSIRGSFNVTGVARSATGTYTVTLTTPLPDTNGCVVTNARNVGTGASIASCYISSTTTIEIFTYPVASGVLTNTNQIHCAIFR